MGLIELPQNPADMVADPTGKQLKTASAHPHGSRQLLDLTNIYRQADNVEPADKAEERNWREGLEPSAVGTFHKASLPGERLTIGKRA